MYDAQGTKLFIGDTGSPQNYTQVLKARRISDPTFARSWKDRTDLDSTAREGKPGMMDIGEMGIEVFWYPDDAAAHAAMLAAFEANTKKQFRIEWPDTGASYVDFDGYVLSFGGVEEVDGDLVRQFTLRGTGAPNFGS